MEEEDDGFLTSSATWTSLLFTLLVTAFFFTATSYTFTGTFFFQNDLGRVARQWQRAVTSFGGPSGDAVFSYDELRAFDGVQDPNGPLYLVILDHVFDVTEGRHVYGPKEGKVEGYSIFLGRDATASFVTGCFDLECLDGQADRKFTPEEAEAIVQWLKFYLDHETYTLVGMVREEERKWTTFLAETPWPEGKMSSP